MNGGTGTIPPTPVNSNEPEERAKGVTGAILSEWEPTILEWLKNKQYEQVLDQLEEWDRAYSEWWTRFGAYLDQIPTSLIHQRPRLLLRTVLPLFWQGKESDAFALLQLGEEKIKQTDDPSALLDAEITRANLYVCSRRYDKAFEAHTALAKKKLNVQQRCNVLNALGILNATHTQDLNAARENLKEVEELALDSGTQMTYLIALINRAWHVEIPQGQFSEANMIAQKMIEARPSAKDSPFVRMCALLILGTVQYEHGNERCVNTLEECYTLCVDLGYIDNALMATELISLFHAERGNNRESLVWADKAVSIPGVNLHNAIALYWAKARCAVNEKDISAMTRHLDTAKSMSKVFDVEIGTLVEYARCWFESGNFDKAVDFAQQAIEKAEERQMAWLAARARLIYCACEVRGVREELRKLLQNALLDEYDDLFILRERTLASKVLGHALALEIETDYARSLAGRLGKRIAQVRTFGGFRASIGANTIEDAEWTRPKARALFAFLCLHHLKPVPVDQIIEHFWPDSDLDAVRNSIRVTLSYIRTALSKGSKAKYLHFEGEWVTLDLGAGAWFDYETFERLGHRALLGSDVEAIRQSLELADRPFLPEYSSCEWVFEKQHQLSTLRRELMLKLIGSDIESENLSSAIVTAEKLLSEDPCDETAILHLTSALLKANRPSDALREVRRFINAWKRHYELGPSAAVARLELELTAESPR